MSFKPADSNSCAKFLRRAIVSAVLLAAFVACSGRDTTVPDYRSSIEIDISGLEAREGETVEVPLRIQNTGQSAWESLGPNPIVLSYHLLDSRGGMIRFDNPRTYLQGTIEPGETADLTAAVKAPLDPGEFRLEFDMVREGIAWFKDFGSKTRILPLKVLSREWPEDGLPIDLNKKGLTRISSPIEEFVRVGRLIRLTLEHTAVSFPGRTGTVSGFFPGSGYPQIWTRDAATILPASRHYYDAPHLSSWIEEFLSVQEDSGSLPDWIDARGVRDKNTTETDQEASVVQAAWHIVRILGPDWLDRDIRGLTVLDRLEKALAFVPSERFDAALGLVTGAHTADWGDVGMAAADQTAIYIGDDTRWTADIYDQSMYYLACLNLADMLEARGRRNRADAWRRKAEAVKDNTNRRLWQDKRGFYRVHIHLDKEFDHDFDEDDMFAMGGNALAVLSNLAGPDRSRRIIAEAMERQKRFGISTISGTLLPPYPQGFFKHPMMDDPYEYQNGGQWDWFGARLVYAMFKNGFSREARDKLLEICRKNLANGGFFEWDTPEGSGRGSDYFAGGAGSVAQALFEGYYGVEVHRGDLVLAPRLGTDNGRIHAYIPALDVFAAYDYAFSASTRTLTIHWNTDHPGPIRLEILSPFEDEDTAPGTILRPAAELDGKPVHIEVVRNGGDTLIVLDVPPGRHSLRLRHPDAI
jgi:hypothetical protein